jgi:hypothetical protein
MWAAYLALVVVTSDSPGMVRLRVSDRALAPTPEPYTTLDEPDMDIAPDPVPVPHGEGTPAPDTYQWSSRGTEAMWCPFRGIRFPTGFA